MPLDSEQRQDIEYLLEKGPVDVNRRFIHDTTGRYLGRLDGDRDAKRVIDAIEDRTGTSSIVIPDPGFDGGLDWEQEVVLPPEDTGFSIKTEGRPRLTFPSGFSGDHAFRKPASTAGNQDLTGYELGSFIYDDRANGALPGLAVEIVDVKDMVINPSTFLDCAGIYVTGENTTTNQLRIVKPHCLGPGPVVELDVGTKDADQILVDNPLFNQQNIRSGEPGLIFRGNNISAEHIRIEQAGIGVLCDGAQQYDVHFQDFDRAGQESDAVHRERDGAFGTIRGLKGTARYPGLDITHPQTTLEGFTGKSFSASIPEPAPADPWHAIRTMTVAEGLPAKFRDISSGGEIVLNARQYSPDLLIKSGGQAGDTGGFDHGVDAQGDYGLKARSYPKIGFGLDWGDTAGCTFRAGWYADANNRAEIVYDTTGSETSPTVPTTSNFVAQVITGGSEDLNADLGVAPSTSIEFIYHVARYADGRNDEDHWTFHLRDGEADDPDATSYFDEGTESTDLDNTKGTPRVQYKNQDGNGSQIVLLQEKDMHCYRL